MTARPTLTWLVALAVALQSIWLPSLAAGRVADVAARAGAVPLCAPSGARTHLVAPDGRLLPAEPDDESKSTRHCPDCRLISPLPGFEPPSVVLPAPCFAAGVAIDPPRSSERSVLLLRTGSPRGPPITF